MQFHCIKMRYSIEPRDGICETISIHVFCQKQSNKYGKKLVDTAKKSATGAIKTGSKRAIQKAAEATGDLIGNKIADKIASVSKKKCNNNNNDDVELTTNKKRYISPEERQQIIDELRLVPRNY